MGRISGISGISGLSGISGPHYFPSIIVKGRVSSIPPGGDLFLKASVYIIRPVFGKTADIRRMGPDASLPYFAICLYKVEIYEIFVTESACGLGSDTL